MKKIRILLSLPFLILIAVVYAVVIIPIVIVAAIIGGDEVAKLLNEAFFNNKR